MFRDFSNFDVEDFAFDESFQKWVKGVGPDHRAFWERYMQENPHQLDKLLAARELVLQLSAANIEPQKELDDLSKTIWTNVEKNIKAGRNVSFHWLRWGYVASVAMLIAFGSYWYSKMKIEERTSEVYRQHVDTVDEGVVYMEKVNTRDEVQTIVLGDGSTVALEKNSSLRYPTVFGTGDRKVYLDGEAFFDVRKDAKHPFLVFTGKTVVKVLGTSFRVRAHNRSGKVVVAVRSGKVSVFERKDFEAVSENQQVSGLVLLANQQAEFSNDLEKFSKMIVPDPGIIGTVEKKEFDFNETPLNLVFETLEKAYGIEIIVDYDLINGRHLKVSLEDESLTEKLDVICQTMGLTYQIVDARIIIEPQ